MMNNIMVPRLHFRVVITVFLFGALLCRASLYAADTPSGNAPKKLFFIENKKQWDSTIFYESELQGGRLYLEKNLFTYQFLNPTDAQMVHPHEGTQLTSLHFHAFKVHFENSNADPVISASEQMSAYHNYFIGKDSSRWAGNVHLYRTVNYKDIYPGVDLNVYSRYFNLKYDFVISPGSDASLVKLVYEGVDGLSIDKTGALQIAISTGDLAEEKPFAYQLINGQRKQVACKFDLKGYEISFTFPHGYNKSYPLVIDPTLVFATYTGSTTDNWGFAATYDKAGDLYAAGWASNIGYPITVGAYQVTFHGFGSGGNGYCHEIAITKFTPDGTNLLFSTYLGGSDNEQPNSIIVDGNDNLLVYGVTYSHDFPVTGGAYDVSYNGEGDVIVSKFNSSGSSLLASTYIGGSGIDGVNITDNFFIQYGLKFNYADETRGDIEVDNNNNVIVATSTQSQDFPTTAGVVQPSFGGGLQDGVVFKLNSGLTALQFSTYLGGSGDDAAYSCAIAAGNEIYVAGGTQSPDFTTTAGTLHTSFQGKTDGYVTHLNSNATSILHSTYIGTSEYDQAYFVQLDYSGNVYICGQTMGAYPVTPGTYSNPGTGHFIHKMSADLQTTFFSTVFGSGSVPNLALTAFLVDTCENMYVAGWGRCISNGSSPDFYPGSNCNGLPLTADAMQKTTDGCDFYFICFRHDADTLLYASYFGGNLSMEHVDGGTSRFDKRGTIYEAICGGCWGNSDLPTTANAWSRTNNSGLCNLAAVKINFNLSAVSSGLAATPIDGCAPLTTIFTNNSIGATSYSWNFGDGSPPDTSFAPSHTYEQGGKFRVMLIAINNNTCNKADTTYIDITATATDTAKASFALMQTPSCDSLFITATSTGTGQILQWSFGDLVADSGSNVSHTYKDTGSYTITLIARDSLCSIPDTASKEVVLRKSVKAIIDTTGAMSGCKPLKIHLADAASSGGVNCVWSFGDGTDTTGVTADHVYPNPGSYTITLVATDSGACNIADTSTFAINVNDGPTAGFKIDSQTVYLANEDIYIYDSSRNATRWLYNLGDGGVSSLENPVYQYHIPGRYSICQVVETSNGCPDTACSLIDIIENEAIYIPNSFTPNGDGVNDYFSPLFVGIIQLDVKIFDRWGTLIYEWNTLNGHWDGRTNGKDAPEDVYVYKMVSSGYENKDKTRVGMVTLVR